MRVAPFLAFLAVATSTACSSGECDQSQCASNNQCINYGGENRCRKLCGSNDDPSTSCPAGYNCIDPGTGGSPFCFANQAKNNGKQVVARGGQWGASCNSAQGLANPACDVDQGFVCYGVAPTDGEAYCTRFDCQGDAECGPGFACEVVNIAPNVEDAKHSAIGAVHNVCRRRTYCSTCAVDLDCPSFKGKKQHCLADMNGVPNCMPECENNSNCPNEAGCADLGIGVNVCYPRAQVCIGDGALCAPCRSDADCGEDGICVKGQYTTELSCAKKSATSCNKGAARGSCPTQNPGNPKVTVLCAGGRIDEVPPDYCHGLYTIAAEGGDVGCWTPNR